MPIVKACMLQIRLMRSCRKHCERGHKKTECCESSQTKACWSTEGFLEPPHCPRNIELAGLDEQSHCCSSGIVEAKASLRHQWARMGHAPKNMLADGRQLRRCASLLLRRVHRPLGPAPAQHSRLHSQLQLRPEPARACCKQTVQTR